MVQRIKSEEAAQLLGVTRRRIQQLTQSGALSSEREGREWTYDPQQLREEYSRFSQSHPGNRESRTEKLARAHELKGRRIGSLTVGDVVGTDPSGDLLISCTCDCGNVRTVRMRGILNGKYKGCGSGCTAREYSAGYNPSR